MSQFAKKKKRVKMRLVKKLVKQILPLHVLYN